MSHGGPGGARDYVFDRTRADEERRLEKQYMTRYSPTRLAQAVPIPLLGYPPTIVAAYVPPLSFNAVFGTLYLPRDRRPEQFGIAGDPVPAGLIAQLRYPFRRTRRVEV
jgi:hypothetical protein